MIWRKRIGETEIRRAGLSLARKLREFAPGKVVYISRGGALLGKVIAEELGVPALELDLSYPGSRLAPSAPFILKALAAPIKEVVYRLTAPQVHSFIEAIDPGERIALVDDTASSGRTIKAALRTLVEREVDPSRIRVAVIRRGPRAREIVDYHETEERVLFLGR